MNFFNQSVTRNIAVSLMDFFSRISIEKFQTVSVSGDDIFVQRKIIPVPCQWSTREKFVEILRSSSARKAFDPSIRDKNPVEMQWILPRISCNLTGVNYDPNRRLIKTQKIDDVANNASSKGSSYSPASYNLDFEISSISRNLDENLQIMEQILPYFSPTMSLTLNLYDGKEPDSIPITLTSVSVDNPTDIPENDERLFTTTYNFTAKINYYMQKKISNVIFGITTSMMNGQEVVKISKDYVSSLKRIQSKFEQYTANSTIVNPIVVLNEYNQDREDAIKRLQARGYFNITESMIAEEILNSNNAIANLGSPGLSAVQNNDNTVSILFTNMTSGNDKLFENFIIYYRVDNDPEPLRYENPIPITFSKIYYWCHLGTYTDNKSLEMYEYTII